MQVNRLRRHLDSLTVRAIEPIHRPELQDSLRGGDVPNVRFEPDESERELDPDRFDKRGVYHGSDGPAGVVIAAIGCIGVVLVIVWALTK